MDPKNTMFCSNWRLLHCRHLMGSEFEVSLVSRVWSLPAPLPCVLLTMAVLDGCPQPRPGTQNTPCFKITTIARLGISGLGARRFTTAKPACQPETRDTEGWAAK